MKRNTTGILLLAASIGLLIPGLTIDMMTLDISISVPFMGNQQLHHETRSILGTIGSLFEKGNPTVAVLILLFSVIVPFLKITALMAALSRPRHRLSPSLHRFVAIISKWAMADVFVVGVFIAFLTTTTDENISANLHTGFYFFVAYCLVSILAVQVIRIQPDIDEA